MPDDTDNYLTQLPDKTTELIPTAPLTKQEQLIRYLYTEPTAEQAAIKAGYAPSTASGTIYTLIKKPEFQKRLLEYAIANDILDLPNLAKIENKCLNLLHDNPEQYPRFKEIFRQKKQVAGLLAQDAQPVQPTINIRSIEHLQVVLGDQVHKRTLMLDKPAKAQDVADVDID